MKRLAAARNESCHHSRHLASPAHRRRRTCQQSNAISWTGTKLLLSTHVRGKPCPFISGSPPLELHVDPDAKPVACHVPIPLPLHWQATVKAGLDRDVALGVLEKVPPNVPTKWLCRMLCVPKHDGSPRRVVDYGPVNAHCPARHTTHLAPGTWQPLCQKEPEKP